MSKIEEAQDILKSVGLPPAQYNEMAALTFLALCNIRENNSWFEAHRLSLGVSKGIMNFVNDNYGKTYAPNTRETFRRQVLHQFVQARLVDYNPDNPHLPVNSPKAHYALTNEALELVKNYQTENWSNSLKDFINNVGMLSDKYLKKRDLNRVQVVLSDGRVIRLSPGKHNEVQAAVIKEFASRFIKKGILVYLGDTEKKDLYVDFGMLESFGIPIDQHSKLPDIVIYDVENNWLFFIEVVTSHGPVTPKRLGDFETLLKNCDLGKVYVTAFPSMSEFKKYSGQIAWETEVWLMELPDHMIHFNGDKFLGPRK